MFSSAKPWNLQERFWNWKNALESKGLKVNTRKTKVIVSGPEGKLFKDKTLTFVGGESWPIQCSAQNVETGIMEDVQKLRGHR